MTGTGSSRHSQTMCWNLFAIPCTADGTILPPWAKAATLSPSIPAQKARPSPESTTARKLRSSLSRAPASAIAWNIAGSSAFILAARLSRTSATPSVIVSRTRSSMAPSPSSSLAITRCQTPDAVRAPFERCRMQTERLRREAANPELHAVDVNLNKSCVRPVPLAGKICAVGLVPKLAHLRSVLDQYGLTDQGNERIVSVLKD